MLGIQSRQNKLSDVFPDIGEVRTIYAGKAALAESHWGGGWGARKGLFTCVTSDDAFQSRLPNRCLQCMDRLAEIRSAKQSLWQGSIFIAGPQTQHELFAFLLLHLPPAHPDRDLMVRLERFKPLWEESGSHTWGILNPTLCHAALLEVAPTSRHYPQEQSKGLVRAGALDSISLRTALHSWVPRLGFGVYSLQQPRRAPNSCCE